VISHRSAALAESQDRIEDAFLRPSFFLEERSPLTKRGRRLRAFLQFILWPPGEENRFLRIDLLFSSWHDRDEL